MARLLLTLQFCLILINMILINVQDVTCDQHTYCKMSCRLPPDNKETVKHTMCEYKRDGPKSCNKTTFRMTRPDKRWVLEQLNNARAKVAKGEELRGDGGKQPEAGNMMKLVWHGELAMFARRWASQCDRGLHDLCRTPMDGLDVGQNSYTGEFDEEQTADRYGRMTNAINAWLYEVLHMKPAWVEDYPSEAKAIVGNYSQLVWGTTVHVGCGYSDFKIGNKKYSFRFVCNFKQEGNAPGKRVYRSGRPCGSCPPKTLCSVTWPSLCFTGESNYFLDQEVNRGSPLQFVSKFPSLGLFLILCLI